jgi:transposase
VPSDAAALADLLTALPERPVRLGLEAGPLSEWLVRGLADAGFEAVLMETRQVRAAWWSMTVKTDRNDARGMAHLLRLGWFRPVHLKSMDAREQRVLLSARMTLVRRRRDIENGVRGLLRGFGLRFPRVLRVRWAQSVREALAGNPTLLAITFRAAADRPERFSSSTAIGPCFGLTPRRYQSGETDRTGGISRAGDASVRVALFEAAHLLMSRVARWSKLKAWAVAVAKRRGAKRAKVALARKFGVILHRMGIDGTDFRFSAN